MMKLLLIVSGFCTILPLCAQDLLKDPGKLDAVNTVVEPVKYKGRNAIRVISTPNARAETLAVLKDIQFTNGTIELEIAGSVQPGADTTARGFIGLAFRLKTRNDTIQYEAFYLRPTNGRSSDQLRRNHSTQYISHPEFPWFKLRKEMPGVYESYVDVVPGEWIKLRITVKDRRAKLYVNDATQPCLVVSDIKHPTSSGLLALWIGLGTEGHFRNLRVVND